MTGRLKSADSQQHKNDHYLKLEDQIGTTRYLAPPSDIVALIAWTHQTRIHDLITPPSYETQFALHDEESASSGRAGPGAPYSRITTDRIRAAGESREPEPIVQMNASHLVTLKSPFTSIRIVRSNIHRKAISSRDVWPTAQRSAVGRANKRL
jgi:hypothetical protein